MFDLFMQKSRSQGRRRQSRRQTSKIRLFRGTARFQPVFEQLEDRRLLALTINPTFDATITSDPNAATIMASINRVIAAYQSFISDNITVNITFQEGGGLGGSSTLGSSITYASYLTALTSHSTSTDDTTALASVPAGPNQPIAGTSSDANIRVVTALKRALGLPGAAAIDSTITLNTSIMNLDRTGTQDSSKYDLMAVCAHEIDEALSGGSGLDGSINGDAISGTTIEPADLFRYSSSGTRSYDTAAATTSYFSIDGGTTNLVGFNQYAPNAANKNDFADWFSNNGAGATVPRVQDSNSTAGAYPNLGVELRRLDVVGYTLAALNAPNVTGQANQTAVEGASKAFDLGTFSDPDAAPWGVTVSWGDSTANTSFFLNTAGSLGNKSHTYAEEGNYTVTVTVTDFTSQTQTKTFQVSVSDPAVIATGGQSITPVEGANSGSVLLATFTDPGGPESLSDYSADIDWGDGTGTQIGAGSITLNGSTFEVRGAHTYAEESAADHPGSNPYTITITIHHEATAPQTVTSTATVSDPAVIASGGFAFVATEGVTSAVQTVATFTDPGGPEPLADYSALINWGDGSAPTTGTITFAGGVYTVKGSHKYAVGLGLPDDFGNTFCDGTPPSFHKAITVTISHESAPTSQAVSDAAITIAPGTAHLAGGSLIVVGTTAADNVVVNPVGNTGAVKVALNSVQLGSFTLGAGGRIIVAGLNGNDNIQVAGGVRLPTVLYGGPGNDRLNGGNGQNILVGCDGDDDLIGGLLNDLLIGGNGADRLNGGGGGDILVAANIVRPITLTEDVQYSHLVAALNGGPILADDDGDVDVLQGASGKDEFFAHFQGILGKDIVHGKAEFVFDV